MRSHGANILSFPGMTISTPPDAAVWLLVAHQSDITNPLKFIWRRSKPLSSRLEPHAYELFTRLYPHITETAPASMAALNGGAYASTHVRSLASVLVDNRFVS